MNKLCEIVGYLGMFGMLPGMALWWASQIAFPDSERWPPAPSSDPRLRLAMTVCVIVPLAAVWWSGRRSEEMAREQEVKNARIWEELRSFHESL